MLDVGQSIKMLNIICTSDLHGNLPNIPACDLLLIGGDICPKHDHNVNFQRSWIETNFRNWLNDVSAQRIVFVAGNHDFCFENKRYSLNSFCLQNKEVFYLEDDDIDFYIDQDHEPIRIYGTPWNNYFHNWAFNLYEKDLAEKFKKIPTGLDILLTHEPCYGILDLAKVYTPFGPTDSHEGSSSLLKKVMEVEPKIHVFGHLHKNFGIRRLGKTKFINASFVDDHYQVRHGLIKIEYDYINKKIENIDILKQN